MGMPYQAENIPMGLEHIINLFYRPTGFEPKHSQSHAILPIFWSNCYHARLQTDGSKGQGEAARNRADFIGSYARNLRKTKVLY